MLAKLLPAASLLIGGGILAAATGLAGSSPAWSIDQSSANPDAARSRRVCRDVSPTGSRLTRRICRTQADWENEAREAGESLQKHQTDGVRQEPPLGNPMS